MYRDLFQIKTAAVEPAIAADEIRTYGPYTLFNTRAFLIQLRATVVPEGTRFEVFLNADFAPGTSKSPQPPSVSNEALWVLIHSNDVMVATEPMIYEKCSTAAEWMRFRITVGSASSLDALEIVLAKQAWR